MLELRAFAGWWKLSRSAFKEILVWGTVAWMLSDGGGERNIFAVKCLGAVCAMVGLGLCFRNIRRCLPLRVGPDGVFWNGLQPIRLADCLYVVIVHETALHHRTVLQTRTTTVWMSAHCCTRHDKLDAMALAAKIGVPAYHERMDGERVKLA